MESENECYVSLFLTQESEAKTVDSTTGSTQEIEPQSERPHDLGRSLLFHVLNAVLGVISFFTAVFGLFFGVAFLPLCCLGVAVLKVARVTVDSFPWLDIQLANSIRLQKPQLQPRASFYLQSEIDNVDALDLSRTQTIHVLYFLMIKTFISIVSVVVLALAVVLPIQLLAGANATVIDCVIVHVFVQPKIISVLIFVAFWLLGVAGIPLGSKASWCLTSRFCVNSTASPANLSTV